MQVYKLSKRLHESCIGCPCGSSSGEGKGLRGKPTDLEPGATLRQGGRGLQMWVGKVCLKILCRCGQSCQPGSDTFQWPFWQRRPQVGRGRKTGEERRGAGMPSSVASLNEPGVLQAAWLAVDLLCKVAALPGSWLCSRPRSALHRGRGKHAVAQPSHSLGGLVLLSHCRLSRAVCTSVGVLHSLHTELQDPERVPKRSPLRSDRCLHLGPSQGTASPCGAGVGQGARPGAGGPLPGRGGCAEREVRQPGHQPPLHHLHAGARPQGRALQRGPAQGGQAAGAGGGSWTRALTAVAVPFLCCAAERASVQRARQTCAGGELKRCASACRGALHAAALTCMSGHFCTV